jgi:hypothetical protein
MGEIAINIIQAVFIAALFVGAVLRYRAGNVGDMKPKRKSRTVEE